MNQDDAQLKTRTNAQLQTGTMLNCDLTDRTKLNGIGHELARHPRPARTVIRFFFSSKNRARHRSSRREEQIVRFVRSVRSRCSRWFRRFDGRETARSLASLVMTALGTQLVPPVPPLRPPAAQHRAVPRRSLPRRADEDTYSPDPARAASPPRAPSTHAD